MTNNITVPCQYVNGAKNCGNRTTNPTGLCVQHRNSIPLKDIHAGTRKKPLMSAIPRVGPLVTNSASFTTEQPASNEELVERLEEADKRMPEVPQSYWDHLTKLAAAVTPSRRSKNSDDSSAADSATTSMDAANIATGIF